MIRFPITEKQLTASILATDPNWFTKTAAVKKALPANPVSKEFKSLWGSIKQVYVDLQGGKCCFCEKPLEGKGEFDVEHFRPKADLRDWNIPPGLMDEGFVLTPLPPKKAGYKHLAYEPFNYAASCGTCNSSCKGNLFPIEGTRHLAAKNLALMSAEKSLLIYPIGSLDDDPQQLIEYAFLSPRPVMSKGHGHRRALATISIFGLDDPGKRDLFRLRATFYRSLCTELAAQSQDKTAEQRASRKRVIAAKTTFQAPFANCMQSLLRLHASDPVLVAKYADACIAFIESKSK